MRFTQLSIADVWLLEPELIEDNRGVFRRSFCADEFKTNGLIPTVLQGNISENPLLGTLRGFHYQVAPNQEAKTLTCLVGSIFDIVVDLRPDSKTFLNWLSINLSAKTRDSLYVPPGCANAYLTTDDNSMIHYYMSEVYSPASYSGFNFSDPQFSFVWPFEPLVISEKDKNLPALDVQKLLNESQQ